MPNDYFNPPNSIWPNGLKKDDEGYAIFYPLGTNKVDISTITWPEGDKLISPFVYKNDNLVGFVDTKALIVSGNTTTTMDYSYIEANFASIEEGALIIDAPNATVKEFQWAGSFDYVIIDFNTTEQETIDAVRSAYRVVDKKIYDVDGNMIGTWDTSKLEVSGIHDDRLVISDGLYCNFDKAANEKRDLTLTEFNSDLSALTNGRCMFSSCPNLQTFTSNMSSLTDGRLMFASCSKLQTFTSDLSALNDGRLMFNYCSAIESFTSDLSSLTNGMNMFTSCSNLQTFTSNMSSLNDGSSMFANCSKLQTFTSDLSSLNNGYRMFASCSKLQTFTSDMSSLTNGEYMFTYCSNLQTFTSDLSALIVGNSMFNYCSAIESFTSDMSSLTNGVDMFTSCPNLQTFTSDLSALNDGSSMFASCSKLQTFTSDLSALNNGRLMFARCFAIESFTSDLSALNEGISMFSSCSAIESFTSDLSALTNGMYMFSSCPNLQTFTSNLSALTNGKYMFNYCKLDSASVKNIIDTINTSSGTLTLGMGCNDTTEDKDLFAQEVGYTDMSSLLAALQTKGWTVETQYNGRPVTTYSLRKPSEDTLPVFVKLEETEEHTDYTSEDGSKKYRFDWFHETTGSTDGYTQFDSLEEAIETLNIKPIEK